MEERHMERIFHKLMNIYLVLYFVRNLLQDKPGSMIMELGKAIQVRLDREMEENWDQPVTRA